MSDIENKSVLVTGAAGCIGAWVVKKLLDQGAKPVVFDLTENRERLHLIMPHAADVVWEIGDITDYEQLCSVIKKHDVFAVIHLAALQVPYCKIDPIGSAKVNVLGTAHILEACRQHNIQRLAFASSIASPAMGDNDYLATLYGAHKVCGEQMAAVYWQDWQVPSVCIRPGVIYGPGRDRGMSAAPTVAMLAAFNAQSHIIPFSGPVAFVYVEDAADRFIGAVSREIEDAHVFDMQGTEADVADVVREIRRQIEGANIEIIGNPLPFPHAPDDGALNSFLGAKAYKSMKDGIAHTLETFERARVRGILTADMASKMIEQSS
ncbi:NAD-dependent epimerase/dehydratase family protein [Litorimonas sp. RW-G-Af-16]|uniref:NAD-dependent epimerase/dehydratase family protein n=1 Tax=Litorimonas sp. RW-G-Af-16 TaxID=3241168 RepID=UPI00390C6007